MQKEIKYIGFYDLPDSFPKRAADLPATNKMDYICDALQRAGYDVHVVSPSCFIDPNAGWKQQTTVHLGPHKKLTLCPSWGTRNKWTRNIKVVFSLFWLFCYLVAHVKKGEKILVYHSPWLSLSIRMAKLIKGFHLILEVEEIYGDVSSLNKYFDVMENALIQSADSYLFSTELLSERVGSNKKNCLIYGIYRAADKIANPIEDGKIHLLYAGIIDTHKMGAFNAIECTRYLSSDYVLHVIGFGDTEKLCRRIDELNHCNACKILFDGTKSGDDYLRYSQGCYIGLSTQKMGGKYLETSFPSKILSYLCMGLHVVSCYVDCVSKSKIHSLMNYYYADTPEAIAHAIRSVDLTAEFDSRSVIRQLDEQFIKEIKDLVEEY
ncbi:MAG: hypothetical protein MRJ65_10165 [Candidatus Brocadiaceae bacterium]|nr:hypothetical protein [Candidatus Brocadiaceae bacterium]